MDARSEDMAGIDQTIESELLRDRSMLKYADRQLARMPSGNISVHRKKSGVYFSVKSKDAAGKYTERQLRRNETDTACLYAQKKYYEKLRLELGKWIEKLETLSEADQKHAVSAASICPNIASLISPIYIDHFGNVGLWSEFDPPKNPYMTEKRLFASKSGDMLRSKSELYIADYLFDNGFLFKSDAALFLPRSRRTIYTDFMILRPCDGRIIYLEHFGKMDDPSYCSDFFSRKQLYHSEGFFEGEDLVFSFESDSFPLNTRELEDVLCKALM